MIEELQIERLDYQLGKVLGEKAPPPELAAMLPPPDHRVRFVLRNSTTAMANAIRRIGMAELLNSALTVDIEQIRTCALRTQAAEPERRLPDQYFIPAYFLLRLQHLKIPPGWQDTYRLRVENRTEKPMVIYSRELKGKSGRPNPFAGSYRLAVLSALCSLEVENITVVQGFGYAGSHFFTTGRYRYMNLDYRPVDVLGRNGRSDMIWASQDDLLKLGREKALVLSTEEYGAQRPLFIPRVFQGAGTGDGEESPIKEKLSDWADVRYVDTLPTGHSSMTVRCRNYAMEFRLEAVYTPEEHLPRIFTTMIGRLERLQGELPRLLRVNKVDGLAKLIMTCPGEDDTLGQLLREKVFDLDPNCFVNCVTHPRRERVLILRVAHPAAEELLRRAVAACIKDAQALLGQVQK